MTSNCKPLSVAISLALAGCATSQNLPISRSFPAISDRPPMAAMFLDQNGSFYPDQWQTLVSRKELEAQGSLLNATAQDQSRRLALIDSEERQLAALKNFLAGKKRVLILTHGFNISPADSGHAFDLIEQRIKWQPGDAVVRVFWDGMLAKRAGVAPIWFAATGASQLAGSRGLRRILNLVENQDIYLLSHSRGASLMLSALSNPTYSAEFRRRTQALDFAKSPEFLKPDPLQERGNRIHLLMLAPAVGYPDFWSSKCEQDNTKKVCADPSIQQDITESGTHCAEVRSLSTQLKSISYTLNSGDSTLRKKVGRLRRYLNATDLGYDQSVGDRLSGCLSPVPLRSFRIVKVHPHPFVLYAQDPELVAMFKGVGLDLTK